MEEYLHLTPALTTLIMSTSIMTYALMMLAGLHLARRAGVTVRFVTKTGLAIVIYLVIICILAFKGIFARFDMLPPPIAIVFVSMGVFVVFLVRSKNVGLMLDQTSSKHLIGAQSFRFIPEIWLASLVSEGFLPDIMVISGRNYDVLIPIVAVIIWVVLHFSSMSTARVKAIALAFNIAGILVVSNTVIIALLSFPTVFQQIQTSPPLVTPGGFPGILLPGFMVVIAFSLHALSIRQIFRSKNKTR